MRVYLIALVCLCAVIGELAAVSISNEDAWSVFKRQNGKSYLYNEDQSRFSRFLATKELVERHNNQSNPMYKMRVNHMADWTQEEYQRLNGFKANEVEDWIRRAAGSVAMSNNTRERLNRPAPEAVDLRLLSDIVGPVKDQMSCGSCWAFATIGLLEGQLKRHRPYFKALSEQHLLDCSRNNFGCLGGSMQYALFELAQTGTMAEEDYSYVGRENVCKVRGTEMFRYPQGGVLLPQGDEGALMRAVANYGPVAVAVHANDRFRHYDSGIYHDNECNRDAEPNHAMLVVGYGTDKSGDHYWIVKNSWGFRWGEQGYMRIQRGVNMCHIADKATIAELF